MVRMVGILSLVMGLLVPLVGGSLLAPLVGGSCLPEAIPPAQRKNLVNANGESYPMGFFINDWAAQYAANVLAATLVEDILGYNTKFNDDMIGSGAVSGYYGVSGCRRPNNITDRGCMEGVTYYHAGMESWMNYPLDFEYIQKTYTSMAAKNLGSMGYPGITTVYIPKPVQEFAYTTQGYALEHYRNWNTSWYQPSEFFSSITSVDTAGLEPCTSSGLVFMNDAAMRRHERFTGDTDGIQISNDGEKDVYSAKCVDAFWWAAPACRGDVSKCVPCISAGNGWQVEDFMQKFTAHNMPVAIAVTANWGNYTELPLAYNMSFYWWAPDPTFLELSPMALGFPPHNAREYSEGIMQSQESATLVASLVSPDLAVLAPIVESFIDNVEISLREMDDILLDQKITGDSWRNVTCRWLQANRPSWTRWIPDESECFAGFGLYDSVLNFFTDGRINATNKIVCQACPPGMFSQKFEDDNGATYICVACSKGTSQASGASLSCTPCKAGEYQDENRSTLCKRCDFGTYQDLQGQEMCKACPATTSTLGFGAVAENECGCPKDYIDMDRTGAFDCVKCSEGMTCPALSQVVDLERGESNLGKQFTPQIMEGYFAALESPTEVFRCGDATACPGGPPGSCTGGLVDTPCSQCPAGVYLAELWSVRRVCHVTSQIGSETWTGSLCEDCGGWRQAVWVLAVAGIFAALILMYYLTTSKVTAKATVLFSTTASFGMLVMSMQNLGLIGMMTVDWPLNLQGIFSICKFLLLDIDSYGFSCISGQSEPVRYLLSALIFPLGTLWLGLAYGVSRLFPKKYKWDGPKVCSTIGAFLQVGFSTMSATSLAPMMCYKHPNGLRSILKYPGVICGSSEHSTMLVIAWTLLIVFVLGFLALCTFAVFMVPRWSARRKDGFVAAARFLVFRFRLDSWWFGVPLLIRGPLINLPVVLATDQPPIQIVCIAMILTTMMVLQLLSWPWKVPMLNLTDSIISFCIVLLVTTSTLYLNQIDESMYGFASFVSSATLSGIGIAIGIMFTMTASALFYRSALGGKKELVMFNLGRTVASDVLARKVQAMAQELETMEVRDLSGKIGGMSVFDIHQITTTITLLATEVAPPAEHGGTYKFNKRIGSSSFDPSLKRKPQSIGSSKGSQAETPKKETNVPVNAENMEFQTIEEPEMRQSEWL